VRVSAVIAEATRSLAEAHVASARVDAELLAAFVLGIPRGRLFAAPDLTPAQITRFRDLVKARANRIPVQHLTGVAPFRHRLLHVGPGVFVPRPETELLVDFGLAVLQPLAAPRVVDLCAGTGAIAAAIATEHPAARVWAVEADPHALEWLRRNTSGLPVTVEAGNAADPTVLADLDGTVDLVLCNPPYVPEIGAAGLPPEVTEHDPHVAVFGGTDGLDLIRPLIPRIAALLRPGGAFALEHDDTHAYVVPTLIDQDGRFTDVRLHHDLARRPRFTTATRLGGTLGA
jgi:release factor glutamine methyltransferase